MLIKGVANISALVLYKLKTFSVTSAVPVVRIVNSDALLYHYDPVKYACIKIY